MRESKTEFRMIDEDANLAHLRASILAYQVPKDEMAALTRGVPSDHLYRFLQACSAVEQIESGTDICIRNPSTWKILPSKIAVLESKCLSIVTPALNEPLGER
jgi:hypothetical protein